MQEQHHYKTTPDQGWAKMRPMLDEAMPVGTASRRYPFLWWTTTAVVLAGLVGFTFLKDTIGVANSSAVVNRAAIVPAIGQQDKQQNNIHTPVSQPNETKEINLSTESSTTVHPAMADKELIKPNLTTKPTKTNSKSASPVKAQKKKAVSVPMAIGDENEEKKSLRDDAVVVDHSISIVEAIPNIEESYTSTSPGLIAALPLRNGQVVEVMPLLQDVSLNIPEYHPDLVPTGTVMKSKKQPSFLEPGLAASGFIGHEGGVGGFGGAGVQMNVSRRFCVTSSIGFFTYNPNGALFGGSRSFDTNAEYNPILNYDPTYAGNEIYVIGDDINNLAGYNTITPLVDKITQWQINAGLKWKFSRRFFAEGGMTVGLFTKGYSIYPIALQDHLGSTSGLRFQNDLNEFEVIRSTTTSLYAGMGYRLGQHFDLFANWNHGLDPYLLNETQESNADLDSGKRTDYIRGLSVGVRYTL